MGILADVKTASDNAAIVAELKQQQANNNVANAKKEGGMQVKHDVEQAILLKQEEQQARAQQANQYHQKNRGYSAFYEPKAPSMADQFAKFMGGRIDNIKTSVSDYRNRPEVLSQSEIDMRAAGAAHEAEVKQYAIEQAMRNAK